MTAFAMPVTDQADAQGKRVKVTFTWEPTDAQRDRARRNHGQTLERLRERGGVCWTELYCILAGVELFSIRHNDANEEIVRAWALKRYPDALS